MQCFKIEKRIDPHTRHTPDTPETHTHYIYKQMTFDPSSGDKNVSKCSILRFLCSQHKILPIFAKCKLHFYFVITYCLYFCNLFYNFFYILTFYHF